MVSITAVFPATPKSYFDVTVFLFSASRDHWELFITLPNMAIRIPVKHPKLSMYLYHYIKFCSRDLLIFLQVLHFGIRKVNFQISCFSSAFLMFFFGGGCLSFEVVSIESSSSCTKDRKPTAVNAMELLP